MKYFNLEGSIEVCAVKSVLGLGKAKLKMKLEFYKRLVLDHKGLIQSWIIKPDDSILLKPSENGIERPCL